MPNDCESASINAALATTATSSALGWLNPFAAPARVCVQLHSSEQPGTFSLQLKGAEAVQQQQQAAATAEKRGLRRSSTSSRSGAAGSLQDGEGKEVGEDAVLDADDDSNDDYGHLERQLPGDADAPEQSDDPLASLLAAATGPAPSWADKSSSEGQAAGSRRQQQRQQRRHPQEQQQQVVLQQVAELTVAPNSQLQLPVSFCPQLLREAAAQISVSLVSPDVPSPQPLVWRYKVRGLAHADARGVKFAVKCKAKQSVEEVLTLPLPGLDPAVAAAAAAAAGTSQQQQGPSTVKFSHELIIPEEHKAALAAAVRVDQVDASPVLGLPGAEAAPVMRLRLHFAPHKAVAATVQLAVSCSTGARWVHDVHLQVSAALGRVIPALHWQQH